MSHFPISGVLSFVIFLTTAAGDDAPTFMINTRHDNDRVEVKFDTAKATFDINSPFGISHATIERTFEKWPDAVILCLHLRGLENFQVTNGKVKLEASVSSQNGQVRIWKDGREDERLDAQNPYWMDVRMIGGDGKPTKGIPLKDGHFEIPLPKKLFEANPKAITVSWIDFYRN